MRAAMAGSDGGLPLSEATGEAITDDAIVARKQNQFMMAIGEMLEERQEHDEALVWYRRAVAISSNPINGVPPEERATDLSNMALCLKRLALFREALEAYARAHNDAPHLGFIAVNRRCCVEEMRAWGLPVEPNTAPRAGTPFQIGDAVRVHSLVSRPELNGQFGRVRGQAKGQAEGRFVVRLAAEAVLLKATNLTAHEEGSRDAPGAWDGGEQQAAGGMPSHGSVAAVIVAIGAFAAAVAMPAVSNDAIIVVVAILSIIAMMYTVGVLYH